MDRALAPLPGPAPTIPVISTKLKARCFIVSDSMYRLVIDEQKHIISGKLGFAWHGEKIGHLPSWEIGTRRFAPPTLQ